MPGKLGGKQSQEDWIYLNEFIKVDDEWTDCTRSTCCPDFTYVAGRCVSDDINPCQLNLCEQRCSVFFGRVVCTCFAGFDFNREKHLQSTPDAPVKACEDINECNTNNGDCEQVLQIKVINAWLFRSFWFQICVNEDGSHHCQCEEGFKLNTDNQTCTDGNQSANRPTIDTMSAFDQSNRS